MKSKSAGFTLIEMMVAVALIGILSAIALPSYQRYIMRGRLTEAFTSLATAQAAAEQYWDDRHTYVDMPAPASTANFDYAVENPGVSTFRLRATGKNKTTGFQFTIDQTGARKTEAVPGSPYQTNNACWIDRPGGSDACVQ